MPISTTKHPAGEVLDGPPVARGFAAVTWLVALGLTTSLLAMAVGLFG